MTNTLNLVASFAEEFHNKNIDKKYVFHDWGHTLNVVETVKLICDSLNIDNGDKEAITIAAYFHDLGYNKGAENHEERSVEIAASYLIQANYPVDQLEIVKKCIRATKYTYVPVDSFEKIICDADLSHLGKTNYWNRCGKIRQEMIYTQNKVLSDNEWIDFEIKFLEEHKFYTVVGQELFNKRKKKNLRQLVKQKYRLNPSLKEKSNEIQDKKNKNSNKGIDLGEIDLGRGVETMFRSAYRTHVNLSSIADNKANIMLSINAIIISILFSTLVPQLKDNSQLIVPSIILLLVCLLSIIFATLSTRPKITSGFVTKQDILDKKTNLLFFGNFHKMELDEYHWGMMEMIKDPHFLYSSMTRDLYWLGKVLAKKYAYLSYCYSIFMYGLIIVVISFGISLGIGI